MRPRPGWPAELSAGPVVLRPPRLRDARRGARSGCATRHWLDAVGADLAVRLGRAERRHRRGRRCISALRKAARSGTMLPFMISYGGRLVGQIDVSNVVHGVLRSCTVGYWVDAAVAGRGITPTALAWLIDHCFSDGRPAPRRGRHPSGERTRACASWRSSGCGARATTSASWTSTAAGATTSASRSPSRNCAGRRCYPAGIARPAATPPHARNPTRVRHADRRHSTDTPRTSPATGLAANLKGAVCDWCDWRCECCHR